VHSPRSNGARCKSRRIRYPRLADAWAAANGTPNGETWALQTLCDTGVESAASTKLIADAQAV